MSTCLLICFDLLQKEDESKPNCCSRCVLRHDPRGLLQRLEKRFNFRCDYLTLHSSTENRQMNAPCIILNWVNNKNSRFWSDHNRPILVACSCRSKALLIEHTRMDSESKQPMKIKHDMPPAKSMLSPSPCKPVKIKESFLREQAYLRSAIFE